MDKGKRIVDNAQLKLFTEDPVIHSSLSIAQLLELWHQSFIVQGYENKADADAARKKGEVLMQHFFDWWSSREREVVAVEKGFIVEDAQEMQHALSGRFDRIERIDGKLVVIDYKTSKVRTQEEVDADLQLSIYALAVEQLFGEQCGELVLLFVRENGIEEVSTTRSASDLLQAKQIIAAAGDGIAAELFEADPTEQKCTRCPYSGICSASAI